MAIFSIESKPLKSHAYQVRPRTFYKLRSIRLSTSLSGTAANTHTCTNAALYRAQPMHTKAPPPARCTAASSTPNPRNQNPQNTAVVPSKLFVGKLQQYLLSIVTPMPPESSVGGGAGDLANYSSPSLKSTAIPPERVASHLARACVDCLKPLAETPRRGRHPLHCFRFPSRTSYLLVSAVSQKSAFFFLHQIICVVSTRTQCTILQVYCCTCKIYYCGGP